MRHRLLPTLLAGIAISLLAGSASASAASFAVTVPDDVNDGTCDGGHCSLREAILAANATAALDHIALNFDAPITPTSQLPEITRPVFINAAPVTGRCTGDVAPLRLSGGGVDFPGLVFAAGSDASNVCMATIGGFRTGIELHSDGNTVQRSNIGTDRFGIAAEPNAFAGITVTGNDNVIGGASLAAQNVISGNGLSGVEIAQGTGNRISGNLVGLDSTGTRALPNGDGIVVVAGATDTIVGGTTPGARNVISGNQRYGVDAGEGSIVGNRIGVNRDGIAPVANQLAGVHAAGPVQIGGRTEAERNVISANTTAEVVLSAAATVEGNTIGLGVDGRTVAGGGGRVGVQLLAGADGARIGGAADGAGNVIADHDIGVESSGPVDGPLVQGNLIGLAPDGTTLLDSGTGIRIGEDTTGARSAAPKTAPATRWPARVPPAPESRSRWPVTALASKATRSAWTRTVTAIPGSPSDEAGISVEETAEGTRSAGTARAGNTISDHAVGIELWEGSAGTVVEGNFIGTDTEGMEARPNEVGVIITGENRIPSKPVEVRIGGTRTAQRNVISGNENAGVAMDGAAAADAVIEGNYIGVAADGSTALGNGEGLSLGELFRSDPVAPAPAPGRGIVIGGTVAGAGNRIAHNDAGDGFDTDGDGIEVGHTTTGVTILGNEIFANPGLGIDFGDRGVSANGSEPADVLPPFPILTGVHAVPSGTSVQGTIDHPAGRQLRIELFASAVCDPSGHGEGQTPLGAITLSAPGGPAAFSALVAAPPAGQQNITATATDLTINRTSEFSRCALPSATPPPADEPDDPSPPDPGPGDPPAPGPVSDPVGPPLGIPVIDVPPKPQLQGAERRRARAPPGPAPPCRRGVRRRQGDEAEAPPRQALPARRQAHEPQERSDPPGGCGHRADAGVEADQVTPRLTINATPPLLAAAGCCSHTAR